MIWTGIVDQPCPSVVELSGPDLANNSLGYFIKIHSKNGFDIELNSLVNINTPMKLYKLTAISTICTAMLISIRQDIVRLEKV